MSNQVKNWIKLVALALAVLIPFGAILGITAFAAPVYGQTFLGELAPKPHPWLYAETARVGLGIPFENRHKVIGIEDSSAGVVSIKLAGFSCVGIAGGNIDQAGMGDMCDYRINGLMEMLDIIL